MRLLLSGSHGLIAAGLMPALTAAGFEIVPLVRKVQEGPIVLWDPDTGWIDEASLEMGFDAVIHLAGEPIKPRWTADKRRKIHRSRQLGTTTLATAIAKLPKKPSVMICASAVGFYGDGGGEWLTEESPGGEGFLAEVVRDWEQACDPARKAGIRVVNTRFGLVMHGSGGVLKEMARPFKMGMGWPVGSGDQYLAWVDRDDLVRALMFLLQRTDFAGPVNVTSPMPVTSKEFAHTLGKIMHRPSRLRVPAFAIKAAVGGDAADELLLASQRVAPTRLQAAGFQFRYNDIDSCLAHVLAVEE
jgi:uncharacterized protein (TIGR01777 family)